MLRETRTGNLLLVFDAMDEAEKRRGKIVVRLRTRQKASGSRGHAHAVVNAVASAGLVDPRGTMHNRRAEYPDGI